MGGGCSAWFMAVFRWLRLIKPPTVFHCSTLLWSWDRDIIIWREADPSCCILNCDLWWKSDMYKPIAVPYRWSITYLPWLEWNYLKGKFSFSNLARQVRIKSTVETLCLKEPLLLNSTTARTTSTMWSLPSSSCWNSPSLISGTISFMNTDQNVFLLQG